MDILLFILTLQRRSGRGRIQLRYVVDFGIQIQDGIREREFIEMCGFVPFLELIFFKTACMYQQDSARTGKSGMWRSTWRFSLHRGNILNMNCAWSC